VIRQNELIIDDLTVIPEPPPGSAKGLIPRDYSIHPQGFYAAAPAFDLTLIPRTEWPERIRDMESQKSRLSDIRATGKYGSRIPSLDQNGKGYCWTHSVTMGVILDRAVRNLPYMALSAYAVACIIKNFRDEGGWGALGLDFIQQRGVPDEKYWPQRSMSRSNDNEATWKNAAMHKILGGWVDLTQAVYDRNLTFDQTMTLLLTRCPVVQDANWWGHSFILMDPVNGNAQKDELRAESGKLLTPDDFDARWVTEATDGFGTRGLNSWGDSYGVNGEFVLAGNRAVPDGAVGVRSTTPSTE